MKKICFITMILLLVFSACNKKSEDPAPESGWTEADQVYYNKVITLQRTAFEQYTVWLQTADSLEAINNLKQFFLNDESVSSATIGSQGIAVQYSNGMRGGIFLNPKDQPEPGSFNLTPMPKETYSPVNGKSLVNKKLAIIINPTYWDRAEYAMPLIHQLRTVLFPKVGIDLPIYYLNFSGTLDIFTHLADYGYIHLYSHGWAWPDENDISDVFVQTGESASENTSKKYWDDIKEGRIMIMYTKASSTESDNIYCVSDKFITAHNDFSKDTVLFYGGFCYSFLGSWDQLYKKFAKGSYFGFDWSVRTNRNASWAQSLVDSLCDTTSRPPFNTEQWMSGSLPVKSYYDNAEQRTVHIHYVGDATLTLWKEPAKILTSPITAITQTTATGGGDIISDGGFPVTARGICWSTSPDPTIADNFTTDGSGKGTFTSSITGLTANTQYYVRAYATSSKGTQYGDEVNFKTTGSVALPCPGIPVVSYGGQAYNTIQIGTQCWLKENLNIGLKIAGNVEQTNNGAIEKWCYNNDESNCATYGGLYQWNEVMQYTVTEGAKGICPPEWHVPTDAEWTVLSTFLGGLFEAGKAMKEAGLIHWATPNVFATNSSGFTALPGGFGKPDGVCQQMSFTCLFWSSTENASDKFYVLQRNLSHNSADLDAWLTQKNFGISVRCLKD